MSLGWNMEYQRHIFHFFCLVLFFSPCPLFAVTTGAVRATSQMCSIFFRLPLWRARMIHGVLFGVLYSLVALAGFDGCLDGWAHSFRR